MSNENPNPDYRAMYLETRRELDEILGVCQQLEYLIWTYRRGVAIGYCRDANGVLYKHIEEQPDPNRPRCYIRKTFWNDGKLHCVEYRNADYRTHRDDGPAQISYHNNGKLSEEDYFQNGRMTESKIYNTRGELIEWWRHSKRGNDLVNHCTYYDGDGNITYTQTVVNGVRGPLVANQGGS